jgi:hypothetical protein
MIGEIPNDAGQACLYCTTDAGVCAQLNPTANIGNDRPLIFGIGTSSSVSFRGRGLMIYVLNGKPDSSETQSSCTRVNIQNWYNYGYGAVIVSDGGAGGP